MSFQVKFNQASIDKVQSNVKEAFQKVINSKSMLNEVGQLVVTDVVEQTRNEKSIPLGGKDLKLLKDKWITRKDRIASVNSPDGNYEEGKSNLTFTGQLLNSFTWAIEGAGKIKLFFKDVHSGYKTLSGTTGKPIENQKLADYVAKAGRPFVGVRPVIKRRINRIVKDYIKRALVVSRLSKNNVDN